MCCKQLVQRDKAARADMGEILDKSDCHCNEEARWDSLKCKEDDKGRQLLSSCNNIESMSRPARKRHEVLFPIVLKSFIRNLTLAKRDLEMGTWC